MLQWWLAAARAGLAWTALLCVMGTAFGAIDGETPGNPCRATDTAFEHLLGWRMWWQAPIGPRGNDATFRLAIDARKSEPPTIAAANVSSVPAPARPISSSLASVLVSNVPEVAAALPEAVELPDTTVASADLAGIARMPWTQPDELSTLRRLLKLRSWAAVVVDQQAGHLLYAKNSDAVRSIASITKLMTAMVVLDSGAPLDEYLTIDAADVDKLKRSSSHLPVGTRLTRRNLLKLALMSSENRAAAALARHHPQGKQAFVDAMNRKAEALGMRDTQFLDSTGLNPGNQATAYDLALMVNAGYQYPLIREFTTSTSDRIALKGMRFRRTMAFHNSNGLMWSSGWDIGLSKTGYISEAGRCLVLQATIAARSVIIVLLDSLGNFSRIADANRIKRWIEDLEPATPNMRRM